MHPDTASSDLYERFEAMCAEVERDGFVDRDFRPYVPPRGPGTAPPRPPTKSIEVAALFDARVQVGDQRGRRGKAVWSDKSAPPKKGPLRCLFDDYAARDDVYDLDDTNDKPSLMSRAEAFQLAHDFDIVPGLLRRRDVAMAFANADRPAYGDDAADNRENQLDFDEFVSFVCQMATLAWHRPAGAHERKTGRKDGSSLSTGRGRGEEGGRGASLDDARAVDAMLKKLECDSSDVAELKRRLAVYARRQIHNPRDLDAYPRYDKYAHVDAVGTIRPHAAAIERVSGGAPVPSEMIERATRRDSRPADRPRWTHFRHTAIDVGTLLPGQTRRFRIVVKNRNLQGSVSVHVECHGCPATEVRFTEGGLAPGMSKCVDVVAGSDTAGEWLGCVVITAKPLATRVYLMRAGERATTMRRRTKNWDEELDEGERSDRLDEFLDGDGEEEEEEEEEEDDFDAMSSERLGTHVVRVPVYLNVVGHHRELVTRAGATVGFRQHVEAASSVATIYPEIHRSFRADPGGDATAAERLAMPAPVMRCVAPRGTYRKLAELPPDARDEATASYPDFLKPVMAGVLTARTNKAGNVVVPERGPMAFGGSVVDAVADAEAASRFATAASRVRGEVGGDPVGRNALDASGYRLSSRGLCY